MKKKHAFEKFCKQLDKYYFLANYTFITHIDKCKKSKFNLMFK